MVPLIRTVKGAKYVVCGIHSSEISGVHRSGGSSERQDDKSVSHVAGNGRSASEGASDSSRMHYIR